MDYAEALTVIESSLARLNCTLPQGRWVESLELTVLIEQHCRAMAEECKRQQRLLDAPADHGHRLAYKPDERSTTIYAHLDYRCPDER